MNDLTGRVAEETEGPEVSKDEAALAAEVMHSLIKTAKGFRLYQANNPLLQRFSDELNEKITRHLSLYGEYRLDVGQFVLSYKKTKVYENLDPKESLAFRLHADGVRYLVFNEGLEPDELRDFIDIIGQERPGDVDDDIVTLLWERDFSHLSYVLAEDYLEYDALGEAVASQKEKIEGVYHEIPETVITTPLLVPQKIFILSDAETEWLRQAREDDVKRKPIEGVIQILAAILKGVRSEKIYREFADILIRLTENMLLVGEVGYGLSLIRFLHKLSTDPSLPPDHRALIADSLGGILSDRTLRVLKEAVDSSEQLSPEGFRQLLLIFGKGALGKICELLGQVDKMTARKVLLDVLVEIGRDNPEVFLPYLEDQRWYLVRNVLCILSRIGQPVSLEPVVVHISHKEPRVRREVLDFLSKVPDPKAKTFVLKFLRDPVSEIRIRALHVLGRTGMPLALRAVSAIAASEDFEELPITERKAIYETMGELGGEGVIPQFRSLLTKRYWFNRTKEKEAVICSVAGLVRTRSEVALQVLEDARGAKGDEVRGIINQGIELLSVMVAKGMGAVAVKGEGAGL